MYGFSYDEELPAGYQDADIEMRELEERAYELRIGDAVETLTESGPVIEQRKPTSGGYCSVHAAACRCPTCTPAADDFEEEPAGQLSIGVEGEQRALAGLAPEGKPAPVSFPRDATEQAARDQLEELAPARRARLLDVQTTPGFTIESPYGARTVDGLEHGDEWRPGDEPAPISDETLDALERAGVQPARIDAMKRTRAQKEPARYHCAACGAPLERDHYVYSKHTGSRFCWPGEGCNTYQEG